MKSSRFLFVVKTQGRFWYAQVRGFCIFIKTYVEVIDTVLKML